MSCLVCAAWKIHVSPQTKEILDVFTTFVLQHRGLVAMKVAYPQHLLAYLLIYLASSGSFRPDQAWVLHLNLVTDRFKCHSACVLWLSLRDYFDFCCFRAKTLSSILHLVVNWKVFTTNTVRHGIRFEIVNARRRTVPYRARSGVEGLYSLQCN